MSQARFFEMPPPLLTDGSVEREQWRERGKHFRLHDRQLGQERDNLPWGIGDWLIEGVAGGLKPKVLKKDAMKATKDRWSWGTLSNFMTVSRSVEPSRRRETLDYSIHVLVAKFRS